MGSCYFATFFACLLKMQGQFLVCQILKVRSQLNKGLGGGVGSLSIYKNLPPTGYLSLAVLKLSFSFTFSHEQHKKTGN